MGLGLVTDLYELTMAASYFRRSMLQRATFSLFVRRLPPSRGFLVAAGLDRALQLLEEFSFDEGDLAWLADRGFDRAAVEAFRQLRFTGDVWAVPEGHVVFADEPLIEVTASLPEAQIVETLLLNQITHQTALATKAARCRLAAAGRAELVDFSLRRTHGLEAGMAAARAGAIAGFAGTSNAAAARSLDIPAVGTMAHSYVEAFPTERDAFVAFAEDFPDRTTFLVDTYDTLHGVEVALEVIEDLGLTGRIGVRLDSGDLLDLSKRTRALLDGAGHQEVTILASGGLDEFDVKHLLDEGAPIDAFGVGTKIGVSADAPSLDSVYKLVEYGGRPVMKLSAGKATLPGPKQIFRAATLAAGDRLATRSETCPAGSTALLQQVMHAGRRLAASEPSSTALRRLTGDLEQLPAEARDLYTPTPLQVAISERLQSLTDEVRALHE